MSDRLRDALGVTAPVYHAEMHPIEPFRDCTAWPCSALATPPAPTEDATLDALVATLKRDDLCDETEGEHHTDEYIASFLVAFDVEMQARAAVAANVLATPPAPTEDATRYNLLGERQDAAPPAPTEDVTLERINALRPWPEGEALLQSLERLARVSAPTEDATLDVERLAAAMTNHDFTMVWTDEYEALGDEAGWKLFHRREAEAIAREYGPVARVSAPITESALAEALRQIAFCGPDELPHHDSTDELAKDLFAYLDNKESK